MTTNQLTDMQLSRGGPDRAGAMLRGLGDPAEPGNR